MTRTGQSRIIRIKACPIATLFTTNPTRTGQVSNLLLRDKRTPNNRLRNRIALRAKTPVNVLHMNTQLILYK
jgi:hypothetical protein